MKTANKGLQGALRSPAPKRYMSGGRDLINRAAVILKYKAMAVQWMNEADPYKDDSGITVEDVNKERTVYLISDEDGDTPETLERWLNKITGSYSSPSSEGGTRIPHCGPRNGPWSSSGSGSKLSVTRC